MSDVEEPEDQSVAAPRRNFMVEFWTVVIGGVVSVFPFLAGLAVLFDPLRRTARADGPELVKIARLDSVPDDGVPRQFPVVKPKKDAWTYSPNERVGAVFLRREPGSDMVQAFNVVCHTPAVSLVTMPSRNYINVLATQARSSWMDRL